MRKIKSETAFTILFRFQIKKAQALLGLFDWHVIIFGNRIFKKLFRFLLNT